MTVIRQAVVGIGGLSVGMVDLHHHGYLALEHDTVRHDVGGG